MRQLYLFLLLLISGQAISQNVTFLADCNATDVVVGNAFKVSFRLENADIKNINFPDFDATGFQVLQGPVSESNYTYVNGVSNYSEAYIFILMATKTGRLRINPAKVVTSKGQTMASKPIEINAMTSSNASTPNSGGNKTNLPPSIEGKVLFRVEPSTTRAITGEQITLNFKIYTQVDLTSIEIVQEPTLTNVYAHDLRYYNQEAQIEVLNGVQYASKIIHSKAIFPSKEGKLIIEPVVVNLTLGRMNSANPFARQQNFAINSSPVSIDVRTLDKVPKSFTGGVGEYSMQAHVEHNNISTDDAIKLTLKIVGKGDIKQVLAPPIHFAKGTDAESFEVYPPVVKEEVREGNGFLGGIKEFHYTLNPQALGDFKLKPTFSYYDIKRRKMITLDTLIDVRVIQGQRKLVKKDSIIGENTDEKGEAIAALEFGALQTKALWKKATQPIFGSLLFWFVCLLPFLVFAGLWAGKFAIKGWLQLLAKRQEKGKAEREAEQGMQQANEYLEVGNTKALFETISTTLKNYLAVKLHIPAIDMDKDMLKNRLSDAGFDKDVLRQLERVFKVCEETIFAGQDYTSSMKRTFEDANELLKKFFNTF